MLGFYLIDELSILRAIDMSTEGNVVDRQSPRNGLTLDSCNFVRLVNDVLLQRA